MRASRAIARPSRGWATSAFGIPNPPSLIAPRCEMIPQLIGRQACSCHGCGLQLQEQEPEVVVSGGQDFSAAIEALGAGGGGRTDQLLARHPPDPQPNAAHAAPPVVLCAFQSIRRISSAAKKGPIRVPGGSLVRPPLGTTRRSAPPALALAGSSCRRLMLF